MSGPKEAETATSASANAGQPGFHFRMAKYTAKVTPAIIGDIQFISGNDRTIAITRLTKLEGACSATGAATPRACTNWPVMMRTAAPEM